MEALGEKEIFSPAGEDEFLPVDLFVFVSCDDWCPVILVERSEVLCDVACVEFHPGEILHLVGGDEVEVGGAGGARIKYQDAALSESGFDLLVGDFEVILVVDVAGLDAESDGELGVLVLCEADGDLRSVRSMVTAVPVLDVLCGSGFEVTGGPVDEHHVEADIVFFFEDVEEVAEDLVFAFPEDDKSTVECVVFKSGEAEVVQEQGVAGQPLVTSADRKVLGHLVRDKPCDESAEAMAAVFEAIEERWEMEVFKNGGNDLECSYRKGLIHVGL